MILALDTATHFLSVAVHAGDRVLYEATWQSTGMHTVELAPAVEHALRQGGVRLADLKAIAVAGGPGSFTGLRIGMSLAKGLALAAVPPLPLIAIPTLDVTAACQPHLANWLYAVALAGRGRINGCLYAWQNGEWVATGDPILIGWPDLIQIVARPVQVGGEIDGAGRAILAGYSDGVILSSAAYTLRRAAFLAELAYRRLEAGQTDDPATLAPEYNRALNRP
jgi:tRNA threonylcarbamoyladenosine biosynthesis protein TsaB